MMTILDCLCCLWGPWGPWGLSARSALSAQSVSVEGEGDGNGHQTDVPRVTCTNHNDFGDHVVRCPDLTELVVDVPDRATGTIATYTLSAPALAVVRSSMADFERRRYYSTNESDGYGRNFQRQHERKVVWDFALLGAGAGTGATTM